MIDFAFVDSGLGGLPYLLKLKSECPAASCVYIADTKNFPYGTKSHEEIVSCAKKIIEESIHKFMPRAIVVACNTISVNALEELRKTFPEIPFVGTVPAIKLAAEVTKNKRIGLLATSATVQSEYIQNLKNSFAADCELILREDTALINFVEKKSFTATSDECEKACQPAIDFFKAQNCDTVILACTHFLNLSEVFKKIAGEGIEILDSRDGVSRRALNICEVDKNKKIAPTQIYVTGNKNDEEYNAVCKKYGFVMVE